ncbi:MAG: hypothetical protein H0V20_05460, partial [Actinobacteria bacterium]|nr:hypothetical protein [Actinomycetota bacterium]
SRLEDGRGNGGGGGPKARPGEANSPSALTIAWSERPQSFDPAHATDRTAANVLLNVMDPLVRLDENLAPVPNLAEGWEVSPDGRTITFLLRPNGRWTNGDPVRAGDFAFAWKRVLSPEVASPFASQLFGIRGAAAYHACVARNCSEGAAGVGVSAAGDHRLVVRLTSRQPWFAAQTAHQAFLAVDRGTLNRFGDAWAEPENLVTNGPFRLERRDDDAVALVRDPDWRGASGVDVERIEGRVIENDMGRVQAFDAGEVLALDGAGLPAADARGRPPGADRKRRAGRRGRCDGAHAGGRRRKRGRDRSALALVACRRRPGGGERGARARDRRQAPRHRPARRREGEQTGCDGPAERLARARNPDDDPLAPG